jgi:hypothetical protein
MQWTERELAQAESLSFRLRKMQVEGYSTVEIYAKISVYESRFLNPEALFNWRQIRAKTKKNGTIFALRNNTQKCGLSVS